MVEKDLFLNKNILENAILFVDEKFDVNTLALLKLPNVYSLICLLLITGKKPMVQHPPSLPHESIQKIFDNIYYVIGTSITHHEGHVIQHSSNMTIVRHGDELTLINTIRLDDKGLQQLDALGNVKNIVRLGAFYGQDDAFYQQRYHAKLWSLKGIGRLWS